MSYVFKRVLEVRTWRFYGRGLVNLVELMGLRKVLQKALGRKKPLLLGGSTTPFIDKGDGFTSEGTYATELCCPRWWV